MALLEYCWDGWIDYFLFEYRRGSPNVCGISHVSSDEAQAASAWIGIIDKTTSKREREREKH